MGSLRKGATGPVKIPRLRMKDELLKVWNGHCYIAVTDVNI